MNTFYVPALAGMIYTMPGMETKLHAVLNREGTFKGLSSHYSGAGFSGMNFPVYALQSSGFDQWVEKVRTSQAGQGKGQGQLTRAAFLTVEKPSEYVPAMYYSGVQGGLFDRVVNRCVADNTPCMSDVMMHDRMTGGGDPHKMKVGEGNPPVNNTGPMHGDRTKGALEKSPEEIEVSPHQSLEPTPSNGAQDAGEMKNRRMSFLSIPQTPGPQTFGHAGAGRG